MISSVDRMINWYAIFSRQQNCQLVSIFSRQQSGQQIYYLQQIAEWPIGMLSSVSDKMIITMPSLVDSKEHISMLSVDSRTVCQYAIFRRQQKDAIFSRQQKVYQYAIFSKFQKKSVSSVGSKNDNQSAIFSRWHNRGKQLIIANLQQIAIYIYYAVVSRYRKNQVLYANVSKQQLK